VSGLLVLPNEAAIQLQGPASDLCKHYSHSAGAACYLHADAGRHSTDASKLQPGPWQAARPRAVIHP